MVIDGWSRGCRSRYSSTPSDKYNKREEVNKGCVRVCVCMCSPTTSHSMYVCVFYYCVVVFMYDECVV